MTAAFDPQRDADCCEIGPNPISETVESLLPTVSPAPPSLVAMPELGCDVDDGLMIILRVLRENPDRIRDVHDFLGITPYVKG